jgi:peptidoglycan/xylan/chitin deacetylase (PgdA/CDA1 family)
VRPLLASQLGAGLVLLYHRVTELRDDPFSMAVTPQQFDEHLEILSTHHRVRRLSELAGSRRRDRGRVAVAVTFDDGYADNVHIALPRLERWDVPASFFITTAYVDADRAFWWDELEQLLDVPPGSGMQAFELEHAHARRRWPMATEPERKRALLELQYLLRCSTAPQIERHLEHIRLWRGGQPQPRESHAVMRSEEVSRLASSELADVGAHSRRHGNLAGASLEDQWDEIAGSRRDLREWVGTEPHVFSYPFGRAGRDFSATTVRVARRAGYTFAVARSDAPLTRLTSPMRVPRRSAPAVGGGEFERWLHDQFRR